jgi:hypothetical protein
MFIMMHTKLARGQGYNRIFSNFNGVQDMGYADDFLQNRNAAKELLAEAGYSTNQSAVEKLGELCVIALIVKQAFSEHKKGELLPSRVEVNLSVEPIRLQRTGEVNLMESLENYNVVVSLGNQRYRAMLSNTLNRMFALTAGSGKDAVRSYLSGLGDSGPLESTLNQIEWEIIESVHDNVDAKYLEIAELEEQMIPQHLTDLIARISGLATSIDEQSGWIEMSEDQQSESLLDSLRDYFSSVKELSVVVQEEVERQKMLIGRFSIYPRSLVGRKTAPLVGSSWNLQPEFKTHPLIQKFLLLIESNHAKLAHLADIYEDHISDFVDIAKSLPNGIRTLEILNQSTDDLPDAEDIRKDWSVIEKKCASLIGQAKFVEVYVASMDTLFPEAKAV